MNTDQNLLFGVLALQLEFIDATRFVEACGVWATRKDGGLGDVLLERGWIDAEAKRQVDALLTRKLRKHGGDARTVLGTVADASIRDLLRNAVDEEVDETLSLLSPAVGYVRVTDEIVSTGEERSHYTLSRMHEQGGLGRVWLARDHRLHREVALKEIRPDANRNLQSRQRFVREAQITGQLEHPNIVPVYEYGHDPQSRLPFYTMRFFDGQEMNKAIDEYHRLRASGQEDPLELRRLLNIFVSVCNAIAYAHSKGVIHRDLKPSNVMLGAFGEVIVLDWGLAKALHLDEEDEDESGEEASISLSVTADSEVTVDGQAIGTPAYMAPEQARGVRKDVDTRTDVYGLGAILFRLLTGKRPHHGKGTQEILSSVKEGPTPEPREIDNRIHPALNEICRKAMAKEQSDRYQSAKALAEDVQRWLADEPVAVYREPWGERAARWARKHRTFTRAAAVTLIIVSVVTLVAAVWINHARRAEQAAKIMAQQAEQQERQAKERAQDAEQREREAKDRAVHVLGQAVQTVDQMFTGVNEILKDQPAAQPLRRQLLQSAVDRYQGFVSLSSEDLDVLLEHARTYLRLGDVQRLLDDPDKARLAYEQAEGLLQDLLARQGTTPELQSELANKCWKFGELLAEQGKRQEAFDQFDQARKWLEQLPSSPQRVFREMELDISYADAEQRLGDLASAEARLSVAERQLNASIEGNPDPSLRAELARVRSVLAGVLVQQGQNTRAVETLGMAIDVYNDLLSRFPDERVYLEGRAYAELNRGQALALLGKPAEEIGAFQDAIADFNAVFEALTDIPYLRENLAIANIGLGSVAHRTYQNRDSLEPLDSSLSQFQRLWGLKPALPRRGEGLASAAIAMGAVLSDLAETLGAEQNLRSAIAILVGEPIPPGEHSTRGRRDTAIAGTYLGQIYEQQGVIDTARDEYGFAASLLQDVLGENADDVYARDALATALECMGDLEQDQRHAETAMKCYEQALEHRESGVLPEFPVFQERKARLLLKFGDRERTEEAIQIAEALHKACPDNGAFRVLLASVYLQADRRPEAVELLESTDAEQHLGAGPARDFWLAIAYRERGEPGDKEPAKQAYDRAVEWMEREAPGNLPLRRLRIQAAKALDIELEIPKPAVPLPEIMPDEEMPR